MSSTPAYRFAPSPNGQLHLGHAYSALLNLKFARENGGKCLLRLEDIDTTRCTPELEKQMLEDLEWIGFEWDEEPRRQSGHFEEYSLVLSTLMQEGLIYPSTLSRSEIKTIVREKSKRGEFWPNDPEGVPLYPGNEREFSLAQRQDIINSGDPFSLRLDMKRASETVGKNLFWRECTENGVEDIGANPLEWGDIVMARKDTPASYSLCCVHDDNVQQITDIVRGTDLFQATSIHILLQNILGMSHPTYYHHKLILDETGNKLSKSNEAAGIRALRESGLSRQQIVTEFFEGEI